MSDPADTRLLVVDASVLVELVVDGRHRRAADRLLDRYAADRALTFVTAAHGLIEAANALRGLVRAGALSADAGRKATGWLGDLDIALDPSGPRLERIWELRDRMSAYDCAYAVAAEAMRAPLITADEPLRRVCAQEGIEALALEAA